jgi:diacylglycerol kinase family enzyme
LRILLVVNSFASSVTARNTVVVHRILSRSHDVDVVETNRRGHATRFAHDAARRGVDVVVAFGGDGTLNEVANGIAGSSTALGVLPGGSTNVFARTIGLPNDPQRAVEHLCAGLDAGHIRSIGLGRVDDRYFCFHTGVGFDAAVVRAVERHASLKRWLGHPLFIWAALGTWWSGYDRTRPHFGLSTDDGREFDDGFFTVVLNTGPYTYLGNRPLDVSPAANFERPLVAITFRTLDLVPIVRGVVSALRGTGVADGDRLVEWTDVDVLGIDSDRPFPYQVDGDFLGETRRLRFEYVPDAVGLVVPSP